MPEIWKLNGNNLSKTILKWFRRKNNLRGLRTTPKGKQRTSLSCLKTFLPCRVSQENRKYSLTLDSFSLSSQQLVPDYFLYPSKGSDVHFREILVQFWRITHSSPTDHHFLGDRWHPSKVVEKTDCRELLEVHRNVMFPKFLTRAMA